MILWKILFIFVMNVKKNKFILIKHSEFFIIFLIKTTEFQKAIKINEMPTTIWKMNLWKALDIPKNYSYKYVSVYWNIYKCTLNWTKNNNKIKKNNMQRSKKTTLNQFLMLRTLTLYVPIFIIYSCESNKKKMKWNGKKNIFNLFLVKN